MTADTNMKKTNRLANEKSPYLLQHATNPVNWFPWGEEAFQKARDENKPIFLSIGYATCHWCHVMAHECFEDENIARILNQFFVSIKVDREEMPHVDLIFMKACQALTGAGGWPLSVFLTPNGEPFFAGTYFPKVSRMGLPAFGDLLMTIANLWNTRRDRIMGVAKQLSEVLIAEVETKGGQPTGEELLRSAYEALARSFDSRYGGFGPAPKFPAPHNLWFLMRWHARNGRPLALEMVEKTLVEMRRGGIFDQIGYGFHRYSVDERWFIPHFEKMLYDQALLLLAYCEAYQATGNPLYKKVVDEIASYVRRELAGEAGGFLCAEDADTERGEGAFYAWTKKEVQDILGKDTAEPICAYLGISEAGNFEKGKNVPRVALDPMYVASRYGMSVEEFEHIWEEARAALFRARAQRPRPLKDDKVVACWNGLMIASLARASWVMGREDYRELAARAALFLLENMCTGDKRLYRRWRDGEAANPGVLEDYAAVSWGLWELYEATLDARWLREALALVESMVELFWDENKGGFFFAPKGQGGILPITKEYYDGAIPSGNSMAAAVLAWMGKALGRPDLEEKAWATAFSCPSLGSLPLASTNMLCAIDFMLGPTQEIAILGKPNEEATGRILSVLREGFWPRRVVIMKEPGEKGSMMEEIAPKSRLLPRESSECVVQVCCGTSCMGRVSDPEALKIILLKDQKPS